MTMICTHCSTVAKDASGIGLYCPNGDCDIIDGAPDEESFMSVEDIMKQSEKERHEKYPDPRNRGIEHYRELRDREHGFEWMVL